jgi:UDP-N-acetylmuramoyl-tripeptide--D-alanyl-D-alanine ligase
MGANHIGEIRTLCNIARPDYGIITNIGNAHLEGFGSFEGVVKSKTELYEFLKKVNGVAIYDDKNPLLSEKIYKLVNRAVPYSDPTGVQLVVKLASTEMNLAVEVSYQHKTYLIQTNLFGIYNIENVKAAIATGLFLGVEMEDIAAAIGEYQPGNNRSQVKKTETNTLICDSYNANPTSMRLAIKSFSEIPEPKKLIILGDMLELGERSEQEHIAILEILKSFDHCDVILVGNIFNKISGGYGFKSFHDVEKLRTYLKEKPVQGSCVLIKGSRRMTLEKVYDLL